MTAVGAIAARLGAGAFWLSAARWVAFFLLAVPALFIVLYAYVPVPVTPLMALRTVEHGLPVREWTPLSDIPAVLIEAVIASEDQTFCSHLGFDLRQIERAMTGAQGGRRLRGASTLSQQTAKNLFLWPDRSWMRKGLEAYLTVLLEGAWPKARILEVYLNVAEWGPGVFGAKAAAQYWFKKPAAALTRVEAARLAAILPNPRLFKASPAGPRVARRTLRILGAMGAVRADGLSNCVLPLRQSRGARTTLDPPALPA